MNKLRGTIYTLLSIAIALSVLAYLIESVSFSEVFQLIKDANINGVLMFLIFSTAMSLFRSWRYLLLLQVSGFYPSKVAMFLVVLVRNLFTDLLPARIGTLIYVFLVTTRLGIPFNAATSSFAYGFIFDIIAIVPLILLAALFAGGATILPIWGVAIGASVMLVVVVALIWVLPRLCAIAIGLVELVFYKHSELSAKIVKQIELIERELIRTREQGIFFRVLLLSIMIRVCKYGGLYMFLYALLSPMGYGFTELAPARVTLGVIAAEFSASLPMSGVLGFGLYQGTWALVFELLGYPAEIAKLTSLSHHIFTQSYAIVLGLCSFLVLLLPVFKRKEQVAVFRRMTSSAQFYGMLFVSFPVVVGCLALAHALPLKRDELYVYSAEQPSHNDSKRLRALKSKLPGRIVFDSNRSGTFGIYTIGTDGSDLSTLVDTKEHETYPDVSPDKNWIVFASALSTQKRTISNIYMISPQGGKPQFLAKNGTFPTFSSDGRKVFFERDQRQVIELDLETRKERKIFPLRGDGKKKWGKYLVIKPRVSPDMKYVAFTTDKPTRWHAWYANLETGKARKIYAGCEPGWFNQSEEIFWVKKSGARERSGIYFFLPKLEKWSELYDGEAPRGHEYFPSLTSDDQYLLYASCREDEHSHETANYQLFIYDRTSGKPTRLTFDGYNNRWPKYLGMSK